MIVAYPITGKTWYFFDKCLPFGSSISCKIFQEFSDSVAHLIKFCTVALLVNYLDNYFFVAPLKVKCNKQVRVFLEVCLAIRFPVSLEKTEWEATWQVFLGMLIDMCKQTIGIPTEKIQKALDQIEYFLGKSNKKVTVLEVQKLCGTLNFISRVIVPGHTLTRCLYAMTVVHQGRVQLLPHHHVRISGENRMDLQIWKTFLKHPAVFSRPILNDDIATVVDIDMYSDAAKSNKRGFGAYCKNCWVAKKWPVGFIENCNPSIEYLELYGVATTVLLWIKDFSNQKICLFTDKDSVKNMLNHTTSGCKNCMMLIRLIVLESMIGNVRIFAKFVGTKENAKADALSRLEFRRFRCLTGTTMNKEPDNMLEELWPIKKLWLH